MAINKFYAAEAYGNEKAAQWLYDKDGYCPFTEHKIASMLRLAFEDGAASVKKTDALTPAQREAIVDVINERIAGGTEDLRDALGMSNKEAGDMMRVLERVVTKLAASPKEKINA